MNKEGDLFLKLLPQELCGKTKRVKASFKIQLKMCCYKF